MDPTQLLGDPNALLHYLFTPAVLLWGVLGTVISVAGLVAYLRGRRMRRRVLVIGGVVLMVYPVFVFDPIAMVLLGAVIGLAMVIFQDAW